MLIHPTIEKLNSMRLAGMAKGLRAQLENPEIHNLPFEDRLALLVEAELLERETRQLATRIKGAKLREHAALEDLDTKASRGIDRALLASLATCQWIKRRHNLLITGATGAGKTWLSCALSHTACRQGMTAAYHRLPALMQDLDLARHDGRYKKLMRALGRTDLLVLDDLGIAPLSMEQLRDLLEIIDERYQKRSTLITSQLPVANWHEALGDPTMADAILDRVVHNAYKIDLKGEDSMRKLRSKIDPCETM
ncbi:transposase [Geomonas sp. Red276]